ncbi:MAG TPA: TonB-dependent receptor [Caulobacteraceae bacterium]|nr:TonB-dependent receptor [Caulobacteraceae bacterium]
MRDKTRLLSTACLAATLAAANVQGASAADQGGAQGQAVTARTDTGTSGPATKVGEIVITAERREESLQSTPIAVTALTGRALEAQGIIGFKDLGTRVPSLRFGAGVTGGENVITMRGLGSQNTTPGGDSPVAYNIDGVYVQRTTAVDPEFYDVDRVEVLRGPQGTLYGRNSVGGSINVITAKPTDSFGFAADAMAGNYGAHTFRGWINGPLIDAGSLKIDGRLTAVSANHDPYATNLSTAPTATHNQDAEDYWMVRGQLRIELSPKADALIYASYSDGRNSAAANTAWWEAPFRYTNPPLGIPAGSPCDFSTEAKFNPRVYCHDAPENAYNKVQLYSGTLNYDLGPMRFTSVTAFGHSDVSQTSDGDGSNLPMALGSAWLLKNDQFSQEVRLASPGRGEAIRWVAGFIYFYAKNFEDFAYSDLGYNDTFPLPGLFDEFNFLSHGYTKTEAWAPFGQVDFDLANTSLQTPLTITVGLRYSHDRKYGFNYLDYQLPLACGGTCLLATGPFSDSWGQVTGKFGLEYKFNDRFMAYGSASRGYLAGGNIIGLAHVYEPETMWSYEAGFKSRFWDDRVQLNIAGYHEDIDKLQVFIQSSTQSGLNNVNGTTGVNGLETEITAVPIDNLRFNTAITVTDAHYGRYITTDTRFGGPGPGCAPVTLLCNFQGHELNQTPPYTVNLGAEYAFHTGIGTITPRIDAFFSGRVQFLPDNFPTSTQPAYHTTNARLTWVSLDQRYKIDAFVNNIEDADVISNDGLQSITLGQQVIEPDNFVYFPPRTYGVRFAVRFGG